MKFFFEYVDVDSFFSAPINSNMLQSDPRHRYGRKWRRRNIFLLVVGILVLFFLFAVSSRIFGGGEGLDTPVDAPFNRKIESN